MSAKYLIATIAALALTAGTAAAQQYPQTVPQGQQTVNAQNGEIPSGTTLSIRTNEDINATSQDKGRSYSAEIAQDVMNSNGQVLIPRGSQANLTVTDFNTGTMGAGNNQITLALQSINVNGQTYNVTSNTQQASGDKGIGANKRTAEMTGGGAVLGTVLGAVVGGAKGAAIGAVVGAAGGATAQVMTRGKEVKVPAESVLTFKLDQPLRLH